MSQHKHFIYVVKQDDNHFHKRLTNGDRSFIFLKTRHPSHSRDKIMNVFEFPFPQSVEWKIPSNRYIHSLFLFFK